LAVLALTGVFIAIVCDLLRKTIQLSENAKAELAQAYTAAGHLAELAPENETIAKIEVGPLK
jgi:hypothetical protein